MNHIADLMLELSGVRGLTNQRCRRGHSPGLGPTRRRSGLFTGKLPTFELLLSKVFLQLLHSYFLPTSILSLRYVLYRSHLTPSCFSVVKTKATTFPSKMPRQRRGAATPASAPTRPTAAPAKPAAPQTQHHQPHSTAAHPPAPAAQPQAPPAAPVQQQSSGPGLFAQMASTAA